MSFLTKDKITDPINLDLPPKSRTTVKIDDQPGLSDASVSTMVEATGGIIVERAMYFEYNGIMGGHCSIGVGE